jgi:3'(2'), 5'-bisphosphate nucleotidase
VDRDATARLLAAIAVEAGGVVARHYAQGVSVALKADASPVTEADLAAEALILARLAERLPGVPVVSEERFAAGDVPEVGSRFLLVDPLDGTREFVARNGEFTVNIALIENGEPVAGAVYAPVRERVWFGGTAAYAVRAAPGAGPEALAAAQPIRARRPPPEGLVALISRSHNHPGNDAYLARLPVAARRALGSSLKFGLIAEGLGDIYPRLTPTMEWDLAAGHAVLAAAGGGVTTPERGPLRYGKPGFRNDGCVAWGAE